MTLILNILYNFLGYPIFRIAILILSIFKKKVRYGLSVRKNLLGKLREDVKTLDQSKKNVVFQCSSLGEFEQAKPIAKEFDNSGEYNFIFSFFSQSGYINSKFDFLRNSKFIKTYLPLDTKSKVKEFIDILNPAAFIFIKYDLWFNLLSEIKKRHIYSMIVNVTFNPHKIKYKAPIIKDFYKYLYSHFNHIITTDKENKNKIVNFLGKKANILIAGDTKIERINQAAEKNKATKLLSEKILKDKIVFIVGSSWQQDEEMILPVLDKIHSNGFSNDYLTIIAPHEPSEHHIEEIENRIRNDFKYLSSIRFSDINNYSNEKIILIDSIGHLLALYKYADIAYVGGSFTSGLHNVMEPARFTIPVMFGDDKMSDDAYYLSDKGIGIKISDKKDIYYNLLKMKNFDHLKLEPEVKSIFFRNNNTSRMIASIINKILLHV